MAHSENSTTHGFCAPDQLRICDFARHNFVKAAKFAVITRRALQSQSLTNCSRKLLVIKANCGSRRLG